MAAPKNKPMDVTSLRPMLSFLNLGVTASEIPFSREIRKKAIEQSVLYSAVQLFLLYSE